MTGYERMYSQLRREKVDRISTYEGYWIETEEKWRVEGHIEPGKEVNCSFGHDMLTTWPFPFNMTIDYKKEQKIISESEHSYILLDGNGATLKKLKHGSGVTERIGFSLDTPEKWEEEKSLLKPDTDRINFDVYRKTRDYCKENQIFFVMSMSNVFECIHPVIGHEQFLASMIEEPEWVEDMVCTYADLLINLMEILFAQEGAPDTVFFCEDLGYKNSPFMSPAMYRKFIMPAHKKIFSYVHSLNRPVMLHSCGFVEPLIPDFIEAGIDCLQAMEVKAGMDPVRIFKKYGDKIALMGGIDVRVLCTNDRMLIDRELESKIPVLMQNNGYILHSDHSIPPDVEYETYIYFLEKAKKLGTYH